MTPVNGRTRKEKTRTIEKLSFNKSSANDWKKCFTAKKREKPKTGGKQKTTHIDESFTAGPTRNVRRVGERVDSLKERKKNRR